MVQEGGSRKNKERRARTTAMGLRFLRQAERDLETARVLVRPGTAYAAAYWAEQAAEKALKAAYWHVLSEEPPWRHNLAIPADGLARKLGSLPAEVDRAVTVIMPLFDRSRYPSTNEDEPIPAELVAERDAETAVKSAGEVVEWVKNLFP